MGMDLTVQQLRLVLAVHDTGGFTPAAERLHLAQSSTSRAVRDVERKLGITLFQRTTRHLVTTPEGEEFCRVARRVVDSFDAGLNHFHGFLAGTRGRVRVAALPSMAAILLPPVVSAYRAEHPDVELTIEDGMSDDVLAKVRAGAVDLGVTVVAGPLPDLAVHPIATDRMCAVFPPEHRFSAREALTWSELATEPHIAFRPDSSIRQHADRAFAAAEAHPRVVLASRNITAVAGLVAAGLGAAVMPGTVLPLVAFAGLTHVPLVEPETRRRIAVVRDPRRAQAPATQAFARAITTTRTTVPETTWLRPSHG
ncbi:LysR family transcriptional regulator [Saccharopolyspora rhizosphaerae]|uniref:LysR family transcriptional regulator n=1 Tax=Saccharopolyspora rhizosphaerae TaxID=2492662 RepID=A0A426JIV5_9PSEU|nr:LysR family transcriptional regulator [Saccharopolyspora rhizosphaerae]RRO13041.1 LysR family transcriptional regulator [Saccharopolyspora rhizosphaerae]